MSEDQAVSAPARGAEVTPEEVAEVMANHHGARGLECFGDEYDCPYYWPCPTYRVAEALVAERAKVARVEALVAEWIRSAESLPVPPSWSLAEDRYRDPLYLVAQVRAALAEHGEVSP